jgi:hypothetical protein
MRQPSRPLPQPSCNSRQSHPIIGRSIQDQIGHELRAMYASLKSQPVPDHLRDLLNRLERQKSAEEK